MGRERASASGADGWRGGAARIPRFASARECASGRAVPAEPSCSSFLARLPACLRRSGLRRTDRALRMPFPGGLWWVLCCRQGFTLLRRDYGEAGKGGADEEEAEESFELRSQGGEVSAARLLAPSRPSLPRWPFWGAPRQSSRLSREVCVP